MKCVCVCPMPDGSIKAHMDEYDGDEAEGQTFASAEELMAALPGMLEQASQDASGEAEKPMMEGEDELMQAGFKGVRGGY